MKALRFIPSPVPALGTDRLARLIRALVSEHDWDLIPTDGNGWTATNTGSASNNQGVRQLRASTGTTAGSTVKLRSSTLCGWSAGKAQNIINWSKRVEIALQLSQGAATTNGVSRVTLGKTDADGVGALARAGIGIEIQNNALKGIAYKNALDTVDLATTLTASQVYRVRISLDGAGNVRWYVDGVLKGASIGGPTGDSGGGADLFQVEGGNGADSANQEINLFTVKTYVAQ